MKPEREPYIQIIVGILAVAAIPPLGVILFDGSGSLTILERWQSGVGAFLGAFFGLGAILIGALLNASLNRKRDDRLREEEARALAAALAAEVRVVTGRINTRIKSLQQAAGTVHEFGELGDNEVETFLRLTSERAAAPVFEANIGKLGLLEPRIVDQVVWVFEKIENTNRHADVLEISGERAKQGKDFAMLFSERAKILGVLLPELRDTREILDMFASNGRAGAAELVAELDSEREQTSTIQADELKSPHSATPDK